MYWGERKEVKRREGWEVKQREEREVKRRNTERDYHYRHPNCTTILRWLLLAFCVTQWSKEQNINVNGLNVQFVTASFTLLRTMETTHVWNICHVQGAVRSFHLLKTMYSICAANLYGRSNVWKGIVHLVMNLLQRKLPVSHVQLA